MKKKERGGEIYPPTLRRFFVVWGRGEGEWNSTPYRPILLREFWGEGRGKREKNPSCPARQHIMRGKGGKEKKGTVRRDGQSSRTLLSQKRGKGKRRKGNNASSIPRPQQIPVPLSRLKKKKKTNSS